VLVLTLALGARTSGHRRWPPLRGAIVGPRWGSAPPHRQPQGLRCRDGRPDRNLLHGGGV